MKRMRADEAQVKTQVMRTVGLVTLAIVAVVAIGGCGGSSTKADTSGNSATTAQNGDDASTKTDTKTVDPCSLVSNAQVEKIFGEPVAKPELKTVKMGNGESKSCIWQAQQTIDNPSIDNASRMLQLMVMGSPNPSAMSPAQYFESMAGSKEISTKPQQVCDKGFWLNGSINALQGDVYLTASAGLADDSPKANAASLALVKIACAAL